jgi:DNA-3-methyladenine glycosylase
LSIALLPRSFYERSTLLVARKLLGKILVRRIGPDLLAGAIVETEAYTGKNDPASHAYMGMTTRNSVMFGKGGVAYVYLSYGSNYCLNATTEKSGTAGAVLIRALEPLEGRVNMKKNRPNAMDDEVRLTNGPGKLCQAMRITRSLNGTDLTLDGELSIGDLPGRSGFDIMEGPRIGISKASRRPWRFFVKGNPFVSR